MGVACEPEGATRIPERGQYVGKHVPDFSVGPRLQTEPGFVHRRNCQHDACRGQGTLSRNFHPQKLHSQVHPRRHLHD